MADVPVENRPEACPGPATENAGKSSACAGCPNQNICSTGAAAAPDLDLEPILEKLKEIKYKVVVLSGKGGVGKSTTSAMIARALALDDSLEVGLLDVDICGPSQPRVMGAGAHKVHSSGSGLSPIYLDENLCVMSVGFLLEDESQAVVWRGPKKNGLIKQFLRDVDWQSLDYLVIDTPPGTSDEHLTLVHYLLKSEGTAAVVITTPQEVAIMDVRKQLSFCESVKLPVVGLVENMSSFTCPKCRVSSQIFPPTTGGADSLSTESKTPLLAKLPLDPMVARATDEGVNFLTAHETSPTAASYRQLASKIREYFESTGEKSLKLLCEGK